MGSIYSLNCKVRAFPENGGVGVGMGNRSKLKKDVKIVVVGNWRVTCVVVRWLGSISGPDESRSHEFPAALICSYRSNSFILFSLPILLTC